MEKQNQQHRWKFSRVGGVNRVNLESGKDLVHLRELDQKLWTALSCPVQGLEIDETTLKLIDTDNDGRLRVPEILNAIEWSCSAVTDPDILLQKSDELKLEHIQTNTEEGIQMLSSAKQILANLGKTDVDFISTNDTSDTIAIFSQTKFNGDGIIIPESSDDEDIKQTIEACISTIGSETDRSGAAGINQELIEAFYAECTGYSEWHKLAEENNTLILPYSDNTESIYQQFLDIRSKVDDYFLRCRVAGFDPDSVTVLNALTERLAAISSKDITTCMDEIASYPLAKIQAGKPLSLNMGLNPAWEKRIKQFTNDVVATIFSGNNELTEENWNTIVETFGPYAEWKEKKAGTKVEPLGLETIQNILTQNQKEAILNLIEQDKALEEQANNIFLVDKLLRYKRDLYTLLRNFVTFHDFYDPSERAIFEAGLLYIDQRSCELCIEVHDMPKHNLMAGQSGMYLLYCDCVSKTLDKKMTIVAAVTNGDIDNLMVGRNAIFYDRRGNDWDATIVKIIENPISIRQAFWSPYRKLMQFIETQANKFASSKEDQITSEATGKIEQTTADAESRTIIGGETAPTTAPKATAQAFDIGKFVGIFAAIGLALGAIGTVLASFIAGFLGLAIWKMPLAIIGLLLAISTPSMFIAWLKLRKRNLAPLLDANGWAINARTLINITFGNTLTDLVKLPKNSKLDLRDPFAKKGLPLWIKLIYFILVVVLTALILWKLGLLPECVACTSLFH
jgi:hypothetical protein